MNVSARIPSNQMLGPMAVSLVIVVALFWLMSWMIRPRLNGEGHGIEVFDQVEMVKVEEEKSPEEQLKELDAPPPPPPPSPSMSQPDMPAISVPALAAAPLDSSPISVQASLGAAGVSLGSIGSFGGFAGRGGGGGTGAGAGYGGGGGQGFKGKPLIPLSTARPQMPEWACKQKLKGWVEVVFTVMPNGRVQNIKLIDADPRGVFEAAAIESISNWIYELSSSAREVKQRVPMDPEDCVYNWK